MAIEIKNTVNMPSVNSYHVSSEVPKAETPEPQEKSVASPQNYSITPAENMRPEDNAANNNQESGNGKEPTEKEVKSKIDQANKELKHAKTGLDFKYHEATKRVSITVYDKDTQEVIREIPPEKSLDMLEKMWELAGMVVDDRR